MEFGGKTAEMQRYRVNICLRPQRQRWTRAKIYILHHAAKSCYSFFDAEAEHYSFKALATSS
jgi:hypothetical protein